jgi:WD40 repeat protein
LELSPDGKRVAYAAYKGGHAFTVLDGKPGPKYDEIDEILTFSRDGRRFAYGATNYDADSNAHSFVVVDGKPGQKFQDVVSISVMFSPDSKHYSYTAEAGDEKYCVVVDGKPGKTYEEIGERADEPCQMYNNDGKLYYRARTGDKCWMVIDGVPSPAYHDIVDPLPVFSANGRHYAYVARLGDRRYFVVRDGKPEPEYFNIDSRSLKITDGNRLAYQASKSDGAEDVAVIDGKESAKTTSVTFSPDGSRTACVKPSEDYLNPALVMLDGQKIGKFCGVLDMHFSRDNTLSFLAARDNTTPERVSKRLYRVTVGP